MLGDPNAGGLLDPDSAREQVAQWRERIGKMAIDTKAMSDRLRDVRMTASDRNRLVEVTIDANGRLMDLRLGDRIRHVAPDVVARTIMQTIAAASRQLAERAQQIIAETVGTESPAAREIAERVGRQLQPPDQAADDRDDRRGFR